MENIMEYWYIILAVIALVAVGVLVAVRFFKQPSSEQLDKVKEWLLWAVLEAERKLGSGTGALKLRFVYDLFVGKFPWLAKIVSFEQFSDLVDEALDKMQDLLNKDEAVTEYVAGVPRE